MPMSKQLILSKLLHRMQNGLRLTIGPLSELNYEMGSYVSLILTFDPNIEFESNNYF